jgi:hypothetical protein
MARIDYTALVKAIKDVMANDSSVVEFGDVTINIGAVPVLTAGMLPHIGVYEGSRSPTTGQSIAAGTRTRYTLRWEVWVTTFSSHSFEDAASRRDELLGHVEVALMKNRDLGGALSNSSLMLHGGQLFSGPGNGGWIAEGNVVLTGELEITTA